MAIANKKRFTTGLFLFILFWITLAIGFLPIYGDGRNMLDLTDDLFNRVSKDSSYYILEAREAAESFVGEEGSFTIKGNNAEQTQRIGQLMEQNGAAVESSDGSVNVTADVGMLLEGAVEDSDEMFANNGEAVVAKYGYDEKEVMYDWWTALDAAQKSLTRNSNFEAAKKVMEINEKAVEPAYNYYGIEADSPSSQAFLIVLSLAAYILYTVWYGFSLLFMFEGWGLKLEH